MKWKKKSSRQKKTEKRSFEKIELFLIKETHIKN